MLRQWLGLLALIVVLTGQGPYVVPLPLGAPLWSCFLESVTVTTQCQAAPAATAFGATLTGYIAP